jgi:hypothetical protein
MSQSDMVGTVAFYAGQKCNVLREQRIRTAANEWKECFVIRIHGLELWKALRLVAADEVRPEK